MHYGLTCQCILWCPCSITYLLQLLLLRKAIQPLHEALGGALQSTSAAADWAGIHSAQAVFLITGDRHLIDKRSSDKILEWALIANTWRNWGKKKDLGESHCWFPAFSSETTNWRLSVRGSYCGKCLFPQFVPILVSRWEGWTDLFLGSGFGSKRAATLILTRVSCCLCRTVIWRLSCWPLRCWRI